MALKITVPNSSSENLTFGSAQTPVAAEVVGIDSGSSNGQLAFKTTASGASTERMRIDASGNVGIGTTSTSNAKLNIQCAAATAYDGLLINNALGNGTLFLGTNSSTLVAGVFAQGGGEILEVGAQNYVKFTTGAVAGSATERMRIDSSGNVLVNQTSQTGSAGVFAVANTAGSGGVCCATSTNNNTYYPAIFKNASNSNVGNINCTASATAYATSSDYRLKENIAPMTGALEVVSQLNPVTYTWKVDGSAGQGFIAHELAEVVPDCVTGEKDAVDADGNPVYQGIDTSFLVATLTAAIKELKAELDTVKAQLEAK